MAEEELEVCYEQIETLKQELKHQTQLSLEYLQELEYSHGEKQQCNEELMKAHQSFIKTIGKYPALQWVQAFSFILIANLVPYG